MAKQFLLPCTNCETRIPITVSQAGDAINCPNCQTIIHAPTLREVNQLEVVQEVGQAPQHRREHSRQTWRGLRGLALALCLALSLAFVSRALYYGWGLTTIDTRGSAEEMIEGLNAQVDRKDVRQMMIDWIESNDVTLDEDSRRRPTFYWNQKSAEYVQGQIWLSAIVGSVSAFASALVIFAWPKPGSRPTQPLPSPYATQK